MMQPIKSCKTIHFVRHAEGIHNRDSREIPDFGKNLTRSMAYHDSPLTDIGVEQSRRLFDQVQNLTLAPEVVVVSPLRRTLHTAEIGFRQNGAGPPFVASELCRERISYHTCDGRRNLTQIRNDFPFVDFSQVTDEVDTMWENKEDFPSDKASEACAHRALRFLHWLAARPEKVIAVVSHWVFYTHLFALFPDKNLKVAFGNAEMRSVVLCLPNPAHS